MCIYSVYPIVDHSILLPKQITEGYVVTETDLRIDEFSVQARCAEGFSGTAAVSMCQGATPEVPSGRL